ncbi:AMP-binding protein [candidate division KSB1 bacterium]|nr:AMP-binding protein [candidate division KSB1 bacterium]
MLCGLLEKSVLTHPDKIAINFGEHQITYKKALEVIHKLAKGLSDSGVEKGERVAILLPNTPHFIFTYYAVLNIGGVVVTLNTLSHLDELSLVMNETAPHTIIVWDKLYGRIRKLNYNFKNVFVLGDNVPKSSKSLTALISQSSEDKPQVDINPDDIAQIQYTPGIVNAPKGVALSHENLTFSAQSIINFFATSDNDIYAGILPLFLLYAQNFIMNPALLQGAKLMLYPRLDIEALNKAVYEDKVTYMAGSPTIYSMLSENAAEAKKDHALRYSLSYGSACGQQLLSDFEQKFDCPILEGYGVTETTSVISYTPSAVEKKPNSVGIVFSGVEVKIVDKNRNDLAPGELGEIAVSGKNVMDSYWNRAELTAELVEGNWFYTGDVGKLDEEGYLYYTDRKNDVIHKSGFNIFPVEIEEMLLEHPKIKEVAVIGMQHPKHKEEVKACVVLKEGEKTTTEEIIEFCKQKVPVYKCPQLIQFYESLPKNSTGRILKRKLHEQI